MLLNPIPYRYSIRSFLAKVELWRSVKYEEVYLKDYASPREARTNLDEYFTFYNHRRLHQALDYQTPASIYFQKGELSTDKNPIFVS